MVEQGTKVEKAKSDKIRKEKKKKTHKERQERQKSSTSATECNAKFLAGKKQKDFSQIIYYSCNKKGHYSKNYAKPKAKN